MRKSIEIQLNDRGVEKQFVINELPCMELQRWCVSAVAVLGETGLLNMDFNAPAPAKGKKGGKKATSDYELSDVGKAINAMQANFKTGELFNKLANINSDAVNDLMKTLLARCFYNLDGTKLPLNQMNIDMYIDDIRTLIAIEKEALKLNLSFLLEGIQSQFHKEQAQVESKKDTSKPKILTL